MHTMIQIEIHSTLQRQDCYLAFFNDLKRWSPYSCYKIKKRKQKLKGFGLGYHVAITTQASGVGPPFMETPETDPAILPWNISKSLNPQFEDVKTSPTIKLLLSTTISKPSLCFYVMEMGALRYFASLLINFNPNFKNKNRSLPLI